MKKSTHFVLSGVLFLTAFIATAQINTRTGGATNVLANSPTTNTNVGIGTNTPKSKLDVEGGVSIGATYSGTTASPTNGAIIEGNVGIGTTTPSVKLEVIGDLKANTGIFTKSPANGSIFTSLEDRSNKSLVLSAGSLLPGIPISQEVRMLKFYDFPQSNLDPKSWFWFALEDRNDFNRFRVVAETGGYTQMVVSNKSQEEVMKLNEDGNDNVYMQLGKPNTKVIIGGYSDYPNSIGHKLFVQGGSAKIEGNIFTDSNIGIGTSNFVDGADTYRLSVKGKIRAEEIKVYNTWADYVFKKDYQLPTLEEVEQYITKNGHLQNVPSAKEVTEKGLELGEMAKIQQEKIEELMLYIIAQNKRIEALEAKIN